ncbi:MAG: hypothetical protein JRH20_19700 [Deltaproteobacteria bacterium]|nr:hypothetical protein [Deltaproteobacteria bacterium]
MHDDTLTLELFRLRYELREALNNGEMTAKTTQALRRLREVSHGRGELVFEYRRWCIQLRHGEAA